MKRGAASDFLSGPGTLTLVTVMQRLAINRQSDFFAEASRLYS